MKGAQIAALCTVLAMLSACSKAEDSTAKNHQSEPSAKAQSTTKPQSANDPENQTQDNSKKPELDIDIQQESLSIREAADLAAAIVEQDSNAEIAQNRAALKNNADSSDTPDEQAE